MPRFGTPQELLSACESVAAEKEFLAAGMHVLRRAKPVTAAGLANGRQPVRGCLRQEGYV